MDWFDHNIEFVIAKAREHEQIKNVGLPREQQYPAFGKNRTNLDRHFYAVDVRHYDIAEEELRRKSTCHLDCGIAIICHGCVKAMLGKNQLKSVGNDSFIVRNENRLAIWNRNTGHCRGKQLPRAQHANLRI
jgi:hypothetical protein